MVGSEVRAIRCAWVIRLACRGGSNFCQHFQILQDNLGKQAEDKGQTPYYELSGCGSGEVSDEEWLAGQEGGSVDLLVVCLPVLRATEIAAVKVLGRMVKVWIKRPLMERPRKGC